MYNNSNLHTARVAKKDEFFTQFTDIEKEMSHYRDHFRGKTIFCNCDDPARSNFWRYFHLNFGSLGLKKLISTHYDPEKPTYKLEYEGGDDNDMMAGVRTDLIQDGDFRSPECIELLKEADIVASNAPFSLLRDYVAQLIEYGKKFIIIGNQNAVTYKDFFPLIKDGRVWLGYGFPGNVAWFITDYADYAVSPGHKEGMVRVPGIVWYTNIDYPKRHEPLTLFRSYTDEPERYPKYDNYNIINVDKTADIPGDYTGVMGVPISFLDKYCPEQFEILGIANSARWIGYECYTILAGEKKYNRLLIRNRSMSVETLKPFPGDLIKL